MSVVLKWFLRNQKHSNKYILDGGSQTYNFVLHNNILVVVNVAGLPGFRRRNMVLQALEVVRIGLLFPLFSICYIIAPHSSWGQTMRKPFIKFICHSASYFTFLCKFTLRNGQHELNFHAWFPSPNPVKSVLKSTFILACIPQLLVCNCLTCLQVVMHKSEIKCKAYHIILKTMMDERREKSDFLRLQKKIYFKKLFSIILIPAINLLGRIWSTISIESYFGKQYIHPHIFLILRMWACIDISKRVVSTTTKKIY